METPALQRLPSSTTSVGGLEGNGGRKPIFATIPGPDPLWNVYVEDAPSDRIGTLGDQIRLMRLAKGRQALILNGSVGRRHRYRDLVFLLLLKLTRSRVPVLIHDCTWEPTSAALIKQFPFLKRALPRIARSVIGLLDGANVRYAVLSTDEVGTFPSTWGVDPARVVFQPFPNTLHEHRAMQTSNEGFVFAGGNSLRDYGLLERALVGTTIPTKLATAWKPMLGLANLSAGLTSHLEFMDLLARSHAVVVPLRQSVRSAGQQTYLNAMGLGKPVIVTEAPGVRDYIIPGETGVIVPPTEEALRTALLHVMDPANAEFYARMGARARQDVFTRFTEERFRHGLLLHAGVMTPEQYAAIPSAQFPKASF